MTAIYSCPDCGGDLDDQGLSLWCASCQQSISWAQAIRDDT